MVIAKIKDLAADAEFVYAGVRYVKLLNDGLMVRAHEVGFPKKVRFLPQFLSVQINGGK